MATTIATRCSGGWLKWVCCGVLLCVALAPARAHEPVPAHGCTSPSRPADDQDDASWQSYLEAVDAFRGCISEHAEANRRASRAHAEAANAAVEDWNRFVKANLNVPEDFPWPPSESRQLDGAEPERDGAPAR